AGGVAGPPRPVAVDEAEAVAAPRFPRVACFGEERDGPRGVPGHALALLERDAVLEAGGHPSGVAGLLEEEEGAGRVLRHPLSRAQHHGQGAAAVAVAALAGLLQ